MTDKIKVYSFESNSAGGIICTLIYAKANFKLKKIDVDEWDAKKEKFDFQTLPIMKINDNRYSHEIPILLYLGKKYDLSGSSAEDEQLISSMLYSLADLKEKILPAFLPETKEEYENQQIKIDELLTETFPFYLKVFEAKLSENKYYLGDKISIIDIYITFFVNLIFKHPLRIYLLDPILRDNAPRLNNLVTSLTENELSEYYQKYYQLNSPL